jgi:hypothetical protein
MANDTKQGSMSRVEGKDRISYLHTPSRHTGNLLSGMELAEDGPFAHVNVFKDSDHRVQLCLMHWGFSSAIHITASQARVIASALLEAAADSERMTATEEVAA